MSQCPFCVERNTIYHIIHHHQLLTIAIPALEEMHRDGEDGRKKINTITRFVTLGLAILRVPDLPSDSADRDCYQISVL